MFYIVMYACSELMSQASYLCVYYSITGTYHAVNYIISKNKKILPEGVPIMFCPSDELCKLKNEPEYELIITESSSIYDIQRLMLQKK